MINHHVLKEKNVHARTNGTMFMRTSHVLHTVRSFSVARAAVTGWVLKSLMVYFVIVKATSSLKNIKYPYSSNC